MPSRPRWRERTAAMMTRTTTTTTRWWWPRVRRARLARRMGGTIPAEAICRPLRHLLAAVCVGRTTGRSWTTSRPSTCGASMSVGWKSWTKTTTPPPTPVTARARPRPRPPVPSTPPRQPTTPARGRCTATSAPTMASSTIPCSATRWWSRSWPPASTGGGPRSRRRRGEKGGAEVVERRYTTGMVVVLVIMTVMLEAVGRNSTTMPSSSTSATSSWPRGRIRTISTSPLIGMRLPRNRERPRAKPRRRVGSGRRRRTLPLPLPIPPRSPRRGVARTRGRRMDRPSRPRKRRRKVRRGRTMPTPPAVPARSRLHPRHRLRRRRPTRSNLPRRRSNLHCPWWHPLQPPLLAAWRAVTTTTTMPPPPSSVPAPSSWPTKWPSSRQPPTSSIERASARSRSVPRTICRGSIHPRRWPKRAFRYRPKRVPAIPSCLSTRTYPPKR
mmetsp:Transcript_25201/g.72910  ORF Transcript_25201/g.72910 Transcript_25201/m.72910 type:complete len:441 (+) Transcript_25201:207-1529(+)